MQVAGCASYQRHKPIGRRGEGLASVRRSSRTQAASPLPASVAAPVDISLAYRSSWSRPALHYSLQGQPWTTVPFEHVTSGGSDWWCAKLTGANFPHDATPLLEFVVRGDGDAWDKAASGSNYALSSPGRYRLCGGLLTQLPASPPPFLLVTDLDGTLTGDRAATRAFSSWWKERAAPAGCRLAYSSGRSLELFLDAAREHGGDLPIPDLLACSVGTELYVPRWGSLGTGSPGGSLVDEQGCVTESHGARARGSRIDLDPEFWTLDATYERTLDAGWHLQSVYDATYALRASLPKDALHFRPAGEQNAHKVTLGILAEHAKRAARNLGEELGTRGLACRCVVSGEGEWRFLDVLPRGAGKLAALRRAQRLLGFGDARTVAGGDSGNDADVLCGPHRGIVVGNAQRGLLDELERGAGSEQVCFAEKGFAWGLLQGLRAMSFIEA